MALEDELIAIRLELKGQREAVTGLKEVVTAEKGLASQTEKTGRTAEKSGKRTEFLGKAYGTMGAKAKLALGFLGVSGVFAIEKAVHNTQELALATSGLTRNFGFSTNVASRWAAVMHGRGVEPKALSMAFGTLSTKMTEAGRKGGTLLTPFHQLRLTQEDVVKGSKDFEWGLLRVADALGKEEGGAKRSTAAKALLGKGFQTLTPLFSEGAEGLREQLHWADEYGVTLNGSTKDGLMETVKAQREMKVATLGLQVSLTKALMPAIKGGQDELKEFIKTLNDPDLTAEQKMRRIEHQFLELEDDLMGIISDALPKIAEHGGELGVKLAGAVWHGFQHSNLEGKLVIGGWIFMQFGGAAAIRAGATRVGGMIGTSMGVGLATGAVGAFIAYEIWQHLSDRSKEEIHLWGKRAGEDFVNALVGAINWGIDQINNTLDEANALAIFGVDAPHIHHVGEADFGGDVFEQEVEAKKALEEGKINGPGGTLIPAPKAGPIGKQRHRSHGQRLDTPRLPNLGAAWRGTGGGSRPLQLRVPIHLDGRVIAEAVAEHTLAAEALG